MANREHKTLFQSPRDPAFVQDPYAFYARMHSAAQTFFWEDYGYWCFAAHEDVYAILRDRRFGREILHLATREELGWDPVPEHLAPFYAFEEHSLLERDGANHTRLRRLVNRAFTARAVNGIEARITELANALIDELDGETDLLTDYATPIPITIISELLGAPVDAASQMLAWSHDMVAIYQARRNRDVEDRAVRATREFSAFMRDLIAARRKRPGNALIDRLIAAEDAGDRLSADELVTTCILLLNAGHEATVHAIGNGVKTILENNVDLGVFAGPQARNAVDELLRFDPPLHLFTRYVLEDLDWNGLALRKGETVGLLLAATGRDPRHFASPDAIDTGRENASTHLSFGAGVHFCVGAPLARLELEIAFRILFSRLPGLSLTERPQYADRYHFHGLERLMVRTGQASR